MLNNQLGKSSLTVGYVFVELSKIVVILTENLGQWGKRLAVFLIVLDRLPILLRNWQ